MPHGSELSNVQREKIEEMKLATSDIVFRPIPHTEALVSINEELISYDLNAKNSASRSPPRGTMLAFNYLISRLVSIFEFAVEGSVGAEDDDDDDGSDDDAEEVIFVEEIVAVFVKLLLLLKLLLSGLSIADFMITELLLLLLLLLLVAAVVVDDLDVTVIGEALLITVFLMAATDIGDCVCVGVKPPLEFFCKVVGDEIPLLVALRPVFAFIILLDLANTAAAVCLAKAIVFELLDFVILIDVGVAVVQDVVVLRLLLLFDCDPLGNMVILLEAFVKFCCCTCVFDGAVFVFRAVNDILGERSFNCFDMLVVPGGLEVGIICISPEFLPAEDLECG
uniref:Uncharacterized protein n=1 Tax=Glossina austeni TaxID=7395 RepID=A0A1A9V9H7_GLOAU